MNVKVLFFASLRDSSGVGQLDLEIEEGLSVADLWAQVSKDFELLPDKVLHAVNQAYVEGDYNIKEGDTEIAFFPPVTGG